MLKKIELVEFPKINSTQFWPLWALPGDILTRRYISWHWNMVNIWSTFSVGCWVVRLMLRHISRCNSSSRGVRGESFCNTRAWLEAENGGVFLCNVDAALGHHSTWVQVCYLLFHFTFDQLPMKLHVNPNFVTSKRCPNIYTVVKWIKIRHSDAGPLPLSKSASSPLTIPIFSRTKVKNKS